MAARPTYKRISSARQLVRAGSPKHCSTPRVPASSRPAKIYREEGSTKQPMTTEEYRNFLTQQLYRLKGAPASSKTPRSKPKPADQPRADWKLGQLSDYEPGDVLGQGAYAIVRAAVHKPSHSSVALKTYEKYKLLDPHRKQGVNREIKVLSLLSHPNVVKLREVIDCPNQLHLAMELVHGTPLHLYLRKQPGRRLSEATARDFFQQILSAIAYCHGLLVCHRDIKLENMLLDPTQHIKVIDFGFASYGDRNTRLFCGTPSYMAPEIVQRREYSAFKTDVWALGVLLYLMLCGQMPFRGRNDRELYSRIQRAQFHIPEHISQGARTVIEATLSKNPDSRPSAASLQTSPWVTGALAETRSCGVELLPVMPKVLSTHSSALGAGCDSSYLSPQCLSIE